MEDLADLELRKTPLSKCARGCTGVVLSNFRTNSCNITLLPTLSLSLLLTLTLLGKITFIFTYLQLVEDVQLVGMAQSVTKLTERRDQGCDNLKNRNLNLAGPLVISATS